VGGGGGGRNPFAIGERSRREELHFRMVERSARGKRVGEVGGEGLGQGKTPRFAVNTPFARSGGTPGARGGMTAGARAGLTPAAQRLLGRIRTPVRRDGMGGAFGGSGGRSKEGVVKQRWTPTPKVKRGA